MRELENVIERASILAGPRKVIGPEVLTTLAGGIEKTDRVQVAAPPQTGEEGAITIPDEGVDLEELEKQHILGAIKRAGGNKTEAARLLHMTRRRLYSRMAHHNIDY